MVYRNLYAGVDLVYEKTSNGVIKSTWNIGAGNIEKALKSIALKYNVPVRVEKSGDLALTFEMGEMRESKPVAWQEKAGKRILINVNYISGENGVIGFSAEKFDSDLPLTIDPVLRWNTFLGETAGRKIGDKARSRILRATFM